MIIIAGATHMAAAAIADEVHRLRDALAAAEQQVAALSVQGKQMRDAQQRYFKSRTTDLLKLAKHHEGKFDALLQVSEEPVTQMGLWG